VLAASSASPVSGLEAVSRPAAFVFRDNLAALATCRELGRAGIEVVVLDSTPGPAAQSRFSRFVESPSYYDAPAKWAEFVAAQAARCPERPVIFPTEDAALLVADRFHSRLSRVVRYPYAAPGAAVAALDKRKLYVAAKEVGIAVPGCVEVTESMAPRQGATRGLHLARAGAGDAAGSDNGAASHDGKPGRVRNAEAVEAGERAACGRAGDEWIAKPACRYWFDASGQQILTFLRMTGGSKAIEGDARAAAERIREAGFPAVLQERIPGALENLFSVGLAVDARGSLLGGFCSRKHGEYPEPFGDGLIVETVPCDEDLVSLAVDLLRKLGYWGICDIEFKLDERDGRYKLLDANPRVWLWMGLGALRGMPLALTAYALATANNSVLDEAPRARGAGVSWVSPRGAAAFLLKAWRPSRHGWSLAARVAAGALHTVARDLVLFRDPLYVKPGAWATVVAALHRKST